MRKLALTFVFLLLFQIDVQAIMCQHDLYSSLGDSYLGVNSSIINHEIPTSQPDIYLPPTDFWFNDSSEASFTSNYGTNNSKAFNAYLGIDFKGNPLPINFFASYEDLFDPSQFIIQKFTFWFGIVACILIGITLLICVTVFFSDKYVFRTVLQNCLRSGKNISWYRTIKEIRRFSQLILKIFITIVFYISLNATLLFFCHEYIVPIPTVIKIFSYFDIDRVIWEQNIEIGQFGDIGAEYEQWSNEEGFSPRTGRFWQEFLWNNWYILIPLILYFGFSFYVSVFKFSFGMLMHYKKRVSRRRIFYGSVDRHRLKKKMLVADQSIYSNDKTENTSKKK